MEALLGTFFTRRGIAVPDGTPGTTPGGARARRHGDGHVELDVFAATLPYWQIERSRWRAQLAALKAMGFTLIDTALPWRVHASRPGRLDLAGQRDVAAFLDLVAELGLAALVRVGPAVSTELFGHGIPDHVLGQPAVQAVTGQGTSAFFPAPLGMFPIPSYAARAFHAEVAGWYSAIAEILAPRLAPRGPVVALGVDHEAGLFLRRGAYDLDYHDDALADWDVFSGGLAAPRAWQASDAGRCVRWVAFKDEYAARALARFGEALDRAGLTGVARFHGLSGAPPSLCNLPGLARALAGVAGMRFLASPGHPGALWERALYLAGSAELLPFATDVALGTPVWQPPVRPENELYTLLRVLAAGVRAFSLHGVVAGDRWVSSGQTRSAGAWSSAPGRLLQALGEVAFTGLCRHAPVALIAGRADARAAVASSRLAPLAPLAIEALGLASVAGLCHDEAATRHARWLALLREALDVAEVAYAILDDAFSAATLAGYSACVLPTLERVDRAAWQRLGQVARREDAPVVVIGPDRPERDEHDDPLGPDARPPARAGTIRAESIDDVDGLAEDLRGLVEERPDRPPAAWVSDEADVTCSLFVDASDAPRVLFVANQSGEAFTAEVIVPDGVRLRDPLAGESLSSQAGSVRVKLRPEAVRMLIVD